MTLEPLIPEQGGDNKELLDFQHRFWWALLLTVVVTALAMVGRTLIELFISISAAAHRHEFKPRIF